jgi:hypothetical protein
MGGLEMNRALAFSSLFNNTIFDLRRTGANRDGAESICTKRPYNSTLKRERQREREREAIQLYSQERERERET